jgi:hypothetical protein
MLVRQKWRIMRNSATQNVVNLAFASTKGLRSNTRAQGYEDVENEELSAKRFFRIGNIWDYYLAFLSPAVSYLQNPV